MMLQQGLVLKPEIKKQQQGLVIHFGRLPLFLPLYHRLNRVKINLVKYLPFSGFFPDIT
jgi:hypothetical protein